MGLNEFLLVKTKHIRGYTYASVFRKNIKQNICARLNDDFDAEKYYELNWWKPAWPSKSQLWRYTSL